jgi:hypothetical protein
MLKKEKELLTISSYMLEIQDHPKSRLLSSVPGYPI